MSLTRFFTKIPIAAFTRARDTQINTNLTAVDGGFQAVAAEIDAIVAALGSSVGSGTSATSESTLSLTGAPDGSVTKTLEIEAGKYYTPGQWITITYDADPTKQMQCRINSYDTITGDLVCASYKADGVGTFSSWIIALGNPYDASVLHVTGGAMSGPITAMATDSTVKDPGGTERRIGYRNIPSNTQATAYVLALGDVGECVKIGAGVTVPANATVAFAVDDVIMIYNNTSSSKTITAAAGVTLRLGGTSTTGNRTLAQRGLATLYKVGADEWVASGAGLT